MSTDAGNASKLGTDGLIFTPPGGANYTLPVSTATVLGGVKVGAGLAVTADGTLSSSGGASVTNPVAGSVAGLTIWTGPESTFNAIATKDAKTIYNIV